MLLDNKVCVITGAASQRGIGKATARVFALYGAKVAILDIDEDAARAAAADIGDVHGGYGCDVTDRAQCQAAIDRVLADFGGIDVLAPLAGITQPLRIMEIMAKDYDAVLDVSLRGTMYMCQAVIPHFLERQAGVIVCMSSVSGERGGGVFGGAHYCAAKAGVLGLARTLARELSPKGIRINSVAPGLIDTDITGGKLTPEMKASVLQNVLLGRMGTAEEVAKCILFLASDLSSYLTGETLDVNGGLHIH